MAESINRVRRNHAVEHATVAVLLERGLRPPVGGYSTRGGFFVLGRVRTDEAAAAAYEALGRLKSGQRELAVSPYCGTNLVTGAVLAGLVSALIMGRRRRGVNRVPAAIVGIIAATLIGRPIGNALQRRYTTSAEVDDLQITGVRRLWGGRYTLHRVSTAAG